MEIFYKCRLFEDYHLKGCGWNSPVSHKSQLHHTWTFDSVFQAPTSGDIGGDEEGGDRDLWGWQKHKRNKSALDFTSACATDAFRVCVCVCVLCVPLCVAGPERRSWGEAGRSSGLVSPPAGWLYLWAERPGLCSPPPGRSHGPGRSTHRDRFVFMWLHVCVCVQANKPTVGVCLCRDETVFTVMPVAGDPGVLGPWEEGRLTWVTPPSTCATSRNIEGHARVHIKQTCSLKHLYC